PSHSTYHRRSSLAVRPLSARLRVNPLCTRDPSSSENIAISTGFSGTYPSCFHASTTSSADNTPKPPSKFPPFGTLSTCDPETIGGKLFFPSTRPNTLRAPSSGTSKPASFIQPLTHPFDCV